MQYPNFNFAINYTYRTHFQRLIPCTSIIKVKLCLIFFFKPFYRMSQYRFQRFCKFRQMLSVSNFLCEWVKFSKFTIFVFCSLFIFHYLYSLVILLIPMSFWIVAFHSGRFVDLMISNMVSDLKLG